MNWRVLVHMKPAFADHRGEAIRREWRLAGLAGIQKVRVGQAYELAGTLEEKDARLLADRLLADPVTQEASVFPAELVERPRGGRLAEVGPKQGVSDPVADTVRLAALDAGVTGLRVLSDHSASSLAVVQRVDPAATPLLRWRWRVSNSVAASDLRRKAGDDYAGRVYVLFDLPPERLRVADRLKIAAARLLHGADLPAAALCYVWGTAQAAGESGWNAYTDRLRMLVVDSGNGHAGQWREVVRDVAADFRAAFGEPVPAISGVAVAADTDNSGERVEARFGALWFEARP